MDTPPEHRFPARRDWWLLGIALLALYSFCLGTRGLNEPDEGRYAAIAQSMAARGGDWWEPRMSGWGHYDKPPLIYWLTAASFRTFGVNEWAARLPSLLGAALALAGLGWTAFRLRGEYIAWWAVLICGTSAQFWPLGRLLSPDMLLCGWCTLAVAAWAECRHRAGAWGWWLLSLACWTLAWWTKATPALIPLAGLAAGTWIARDAPGRRALRLPLLLPLLLLLGSPWYVSMLRRYPELWSFFFGRELAGRMAGTVNGRHGSVLYYLPVSLLGWLPWWPLALWSAWRGRTRSPQTRWIARTRSWLVALGAEGWIVLVGLAIFSLVSSKLPTYTLPLMPWAAMLLARMIHARTERSHPVPLVLLATAVVFALTVSFGPVFLFPRYETKLGTNSSLRRICRYLDAQGARRVDVDHYWPSMEIYLPRTAIYYVVRDDAANLRKDAAKGVTKNRDERYRERITDQGLPPNRFSEITPWPVLPDGDPHHPELDTGELWFVRFVRQKDSPFNEFLRRSADEHPPELMWRDGDFWVYRTMLSAGHLPASVPNPPPPSP